MRMVAYGFNDDQQLHCDYYNTDGYHWCHHYHDHYQHNHDDQRQVDTSAFISPEQLCKGVASILQEVITINLSVVF